MAATAAIIATSQVTDTAATIAAYSACYRIKEMYIGVPENRFSLTIVESISADGKAIPPLIIIPGVLIIETWFYENMTGHELVTVSPTGYTNEGIVRGCISRRDSLVTGQEGLVVYILYCSC